MSHTKRLKEVIGLIYIYIYGCLNTKIKHIFAWVLIIEVRKLI